MGFYDVCAQIIDAHCGNEEVDKIVNEIKKCQMMFNCSVFTKELRRYITEVREKNPYNDLMTKCKMERENNYEIVDLDSNKAKILRQLLPWEQKKMYMHATIVCLQMHQSLSDKDIKQLIKAMAIEDEKVFKHYETGCGKLLEAADNTEAEPKPTEEPKKKKFGLFGKK